MFSLQIPILRVVSLGVTSTFTGGKERSVWLARGFAHMAAFLNATIGVPKTLMPSRCQASRPNVPLLFHTFVRPWWSWIPTNRSNASLGSLNRVVTVKTLKIHAPAPLPLPQGRPGCQLMASKGHPVHLLLAPLSDLATGDRTTSSKGSKDLA